jgi:hypothetical protein
LRVRRCRQRRRHGVVLGWLPLDFPPQSFVWRSERCQGGSWSIISRRSRGRNVVRGEWRRGSIAIALIIWTWRGFCASVRRGSVGGRRRRGLARGIGICYRLFFRWQLFIAGKRNIGGGFEELLPELWHTISSAFRGRIWPLPTFEPSQTFFECSAYFSTIGNILVVTMRCARLKLWSISVSFMA